MRFDGIRGEPRNTDLAIVGTSQSGKVAISIEAKADESFGRHIGGREESLRRPQSGLTRNQMGSSCDCSASPAWFSLTLSLVGLASVTSAINS